MILLFLWSWTDASAEAAADYPPRRWRMAGIARRNKRRKR